MFYATAERIVRLGFVTEFFGDWQTAKSLSFATSQFRNYTGLLVDRYRIRHQSWIQIPDRSNRSQCCQRLATAAPFFQKEAVSPGHNDEEMGSANS